MATLPPWVMSMLEAKFYNRCKEHPIKKYTFFCRDCQGKVFCKICTKAMAEEHEGHKILKVYRASYQTVLQIRDIGTLFDISDIHSFIINSKDIVFLHQKQDKSHISRAKAANYRCEVCGYELESPKSCLQLPRKRFCSIACKVKAKSERNYSVVDNSEDYEDVCARTECDQAAAVQSFGKRSGEGTPTPTESFRKRSRKGTPRRSPFF